MTLRPGHSAELSRSPQHHPGSAERMRVVLDTSVFVAAFLKRSLSDRVVRRCLRGDLELYISPAILKELERVLQRKFHVPEETTRAFAQFVAQSAHIVKAAKQPKLPKHLANDAHLFACSQEAQAEILVTLDKALLRAKRIGNLTILHPRALLWAFPDEKQASKYQ